MKLTKIINDFEDALYYVHKLGFAGKGNTIAIAQANLCHEVDMLLKASGQNSWYNVKKFSVRYDRKNCIFFVGNVNTGKIMIYYPRHRVFYNRIVEYIPNKNLCSGWYSDHINDPYHSCMVCKPSKL